MRSVRDTCSIDRVEVAASAKAQSQAQAQTPQLSNVGSRFGSDDGNDGAHSREQNRFAFHQTPCEGLRQCLDRVMQRVWG